MNQFSIGESGMSDVEFFEPGHVLQVDDAANRNRVQPVHVESFQRPARREPPQAFIGYIVGIQP